MNGLRRLLLLLMLVSFLSACADKGQIEGEKELLRARSSQDHTKKVILLQADSLMYQSIDKGIKQGSLPTFQYLINNGQYYKDLVSSFSTMSVTIDSSLVTGSYPDKHQVPGLIWFSSKENRVVNYGTGPMEIMKQGINPVLTDEFINLNGKHLNIESPTIYEDLSRLGLTSGTVNGLIYRGNTNHTLTIPSFIHIPTTLPKQINIKGPDLLIFGAFSNPLKSKKNLPDGIVHKMGFTNEFAIESVNYLVRNNKLPDFLYVYLPDLDQQLHKKGPADLEGVIKLDGQLRSLLQSFGSMDKALKEVIFVIIGDSGMSSIVPTGQSPVIDLPKLLDHFAALRPGEDISEDTDIILAVNETMAYIYWLKANSEVKKLTDRLKSEARIDLISWEEQDGIHVEKVGVKGHMRFKANGASIDPYRQSWSIVGNEQILDLKREDGNRFGYGQYPDALRRLSAAFRSHEGKFVIVTAKEGFEFTAHSSPQHRGGGGHGSLHKMESLVPMIICGTASQPEFHRISDIKNYILKRLHK